MSRLTLHIGVPLLMIGGLHPASFKKQGKPDTFRMEHLYRFTKFPVCWWMLFPLRKPAGLYPIGNDLKAAQIDPFVDLVTDLNIIVSKTSGIEDPFEKLAVRKELVQRLLARKLSMLERCIPEGSDWIVGPHIPIVDVAIWRLLGWFTLGILSGLPPDLLKISPKSSGSVWLRIAILRFKNRWR